MFSPIILALSAVLASPWAHQILYHGAHVTSLQLPLAVFVAAMVAIVLGPFLLFSPPWKKLKRQRFVAYGALVGNHGWLVQQRWILGEQVDGKGRFDALEFGPLVDTVSMYAALNQHGIVAEVLKVC